MRASIPAVLLAVVLAGMTTGCSGRQGQKVQVSKHSTYPHHAHDKNGMPYPRPGDPPPPPHNHSHGPTWK